MPVRLQICQHIALYGDGLLAQPGVQILFAVKGILFPVRVGRNVPGLFSFGLRIVRLHRALRRACCGILISLRVLIHFRSLREDIIHSVIRLDRRAGFYQSFLAFIVAPKHLAAVIQDGKAQIGFCADVSRVSPMQKGAADPVGITARFILCNAVQKALGVCGISIHLVDNQRT